MQLRGIIQTAELVEEPPGSDRVELVVLVQGVGPGQPRRLVLPYELLLSDESLDPDVIRGHAFEAEVEEQAPKRWLVRSIAVAERRVLRPEE